MVAGPTFRESTTGTLTPIEATEGRAAEGFMKLFGAFGGILSVFLFRQPGTSGSSLAPITVAHLFGFQVCEIS